MIDLNSDLGELPEQRPVDLELLRIVTSANIACGGHAGDEDSMREVVSAAVARGVAIGAHPSYPDRAGFGRQEMKLSDGDLEASVYEQVASLVGVSRELGASVAHVKPHGALYHATAHTRLIADAVGRAVHRADARLVMIGQAGSAALRWWREMGLRVAAEGFADRLYAPDGSLTPRNVPGSLITNPEQAAAQAVRLACGQGPVASDSSVIPMEVQTICIHSDTPGAVAVAAAVRQALEHAGVRIGALQVPKRE